MSFSQMVKQKVMHLNGPKKPTLRTTVFFVGVSTAAAARRPLAATASAIEQAKVRFPTLSPFQLGQPFIYNNEAIVNKSRTEC